MRRLTAVHGGLCLWATCGRRTVHDNPYREKTGEEISNDARDSAKEALLQFNLMVQRGVEADALTYTSLIATMARAKLEWQAYKLFSRMLESNIKPLPETYVALRDATSPKRGKLLEDLERKIHESVETFPTTLAASVAEKQREADRQCVARFEEYFRDEVPKPEPMHKEGSQLIMEAPPSDEIPASDDATNAPYPRVHIRGPGDVWSSHTAMEELGMLGGVVDAPAASPTSREVLRTALFKLDEEELRIYLAIQRQLRHGTKEDLVNRVLANVGERELRAMISRRSKYFQSVGELLKIDLDALDTATSAPPAEPPKSELSRHEETYETQPRALRTPWGVIHKPQVVRTDSNTDRLPNIEKIERIALTSEEHELLLRKAHIDELDEVPLSLLRRYAFQFKLRWRRSVPNSLVSIVEWHLKSGREGNDSSTPSLRLQAAAGDMERTLDNFEAFRIIAQRTHNLQVVDSKEVNLHINRARTSSAVADNRAAVQQRREHNLREADALRLQARTVAPRPLEDPSDTGEGARVLGTSTPSTPPELPPWALLSDSGVAYNFKTKRFGDPTQGIVQELSDGKFRLLPRRDAQEQHRVDLNSLPADVREPIRQAAAAEEQQASSAEAERREKLNHQKFRRFDSFVRKAKEKSVRIKQETLQDGVRPIPMKRRMSQQLRSGREGQRLAPADLEQFFKSSL